MPPCGPRRADGTGGAGWASGWMRGRVEGLRASCWCCFERRNATGSFTPSCVASAHSTLKREMFSPCANQKQKASASRPGSRAAPAPASAQCWSRERARGVGGTAGHTSSKVRRWRRSNASSTWLGPPSLPPGGAQAEHMLRCLCVVLAQAEHTDVRRGVCAWLFVRGSDDSPHVE